MVNAEFLQIDSYIFPTPSATILTPSQARDLDTGTLVDGSPYYSVASNMGPSSLTFNSGELHWVDKTGRDLLLTKWKNKQTFTLQTTLVDPDLLITFIGAFFTERPVFKEVGGFARSRFNYEFKVIVGDF